MISKSAIPVSVLYLLAFLAFPSASAALDQDDTSRRGLYFGAAVGCIPSRRIRVHADEPRHPDEL